MARSAKTDLRMISVGVAAGIGLFVGMLVMGMQPSDEANSLPTPSDVDPRLGLVGVDGRRVTLESLRGDYVVVSFGFTQCPDVCPSTLMRITAALDRLGPAAERIRPLFITLDPERDGIQRLQRYTSAFDSRLEALRGTADATDRTAASFDVQYRRVELDNGGYTLAHTAAIFVLGPKGDCLAVYPNDRAPERLAKDLQRILTG